MSGVRAIDSKKLFAVLIAAIMIVGIASPFTVTPVSAQTVTTSPALRIVLLTPTPNPVRQQWAQLITNNLRTIGVQAERVVAGWGTIYDRALTPDPSVVGLTYDQGGFDALFVGNAMNPDANPYGLFHSSQFAPDGQNYYLWNDTYADALMLNITKTPDPTARFNLVRQWQAHAYDELPVVTIMYNREVVAFAKNVNGTPFIQYHYPLWCAAEQWKYLDSSTAMIIAQTGPCPEESLVPYLSTSYYDVTGSSSLYGEGGGFGLLIRNLTFQMVPYMAQSYKHSDDYLNWTFKVQSGIKFHDGETLDGRDIVATMRTVLSPAFGSPVYSFFRSILGNDADGYGNYSVWYAGEQGTRGASWPLDYHNVSFRLPRVWAFFEPDVGGAFIFPGHVLANSSTYDWTGNAFLSPNAATLATFRQTSFSTGLAVPYTYYFKNGTATSYTGPLGAGPYKFQGIDPIEATFTSTKFDGYFRKAALEATGAYKIVTFRVKEIAGTVAALAALRNDEVQVLDSQYQLQRDISALDPAWSGYVAYDAFADQELGINMRHPVLGTGVDTPLGNAFPARAAEAARHVRRAIEYCVPKDYIIRTLVGGFGTFGVTTPVTPAMQGGKAFNWDVYANVRNETAANARLLAMQELREAGYDILPVVPPSFWDTYGILLSVVELAVVVVLAGFIIYRLRAPVE